MPTAPPYTGRCGCGGVTFRLEAAPEAVGYCHCTRCQRRSGAAASAQARIDGRTLTMLTGAELVRSWQHPDGGRIKQFCSVCGSQLFATGAAADDHQTSVRLGVLDPGHGLVPTFRQFCDNAAEWEPLPDDGLTRHGESASRPLLD